MRQLCTFLLSVFAAATLTACAGGSGPQGQGDSLPPPGFPVSQPISGQICGGMVASQQSCPVGQYCHRTIEAMCGAADAPGECRITPEMCTMDYSPVCGCDGQTYSNECVANGHGVSAASIGECR